MRKFFILSAAAAVLSATPALAQDRGRSLRDIDPDQAAALLRNPAALDMATALIGQFADAFLQTRVGPMAMLTDPRDDVRANDTLGDVVRRDDPDFDRKLRDGTRRSLRVAGAAAGAGLEMSREMRATMERMRRVLDRAGDY